MYLEPGFGGMLLQILVAIAAAGGVMVFSLRRKIAALFSKNKSKGFPVGDNAGDTTGKADVIDMLESGNEDEKT